MNYQTILFFVMQAIFLSYLLFVWMRYGAQSSISMSYYVLPENLRPLFTFFCWGFALPAMILGSSGLMFFAGAGIAFVGAACQIKRELTRNVHMVGAYGGIALAQLAIIFSYDLWYVSAIFFLSIPFFKYVIKSNWIWWVEIVAFTSMSLALGLQVF